MPSTLSNKIELSGQLMKSKSLCSLSKEIYMKYWMKYYEMQWDKDESD